MCQPVGNEHVSIVPNSDSRVEQSISTNPFAKALVGIFEDQFGRKIYPVALIVNDDAPDYLRNIDALTGFRNALAISTIIKGHEHSLTSSFVAYPLYSDFFDFYPLTVSRDNDGFIKRTPSVLGFDDEHDEFRDQISPTLGGPARIGTGGPARIGTGGPARIGTGGPARIGTGGPARMTPVRRSFPPGSQHYWIDRHFLPHSNTCIV